MKPPELGIIVSTLWRPQILAWFMQTIAKTTPPVFRFYPSIWKEDDATLLKIKYELSNLYPDLVTVRCAEKSTNIKINEAYYQTTEPFVLIAADRVEFKPGWYEHCSNLLRQDPKLQVIGIRNEIETDTSSAFLVRRGYEGVIDAPNKLFNDSYEHEFADTEFKETAKHRGVFHQTGAECTVFHHTSRFPGSRFPADATVLRSHERHDECRRLFHSRRSLWS